MLLFFIAQSLAANPECSVSAQINATDTIEVISCDEILNPYISAGVKYWNDLGFNLVFNKEKSYDCNKIDMKDSGKIYFQINNEEVEKIENKNNKTYRAISYSYDDGLYSKFLRGEIFVKSGKKPSWSLLMAHELGHTLGFPHVNDSCIGYIMHRTEAGMGSNF